MMIIRRIIKSAALGALVTVFVWMMISFIEINTMNHSHNPHYSDWNVFSIASGYAADGVSA